MRFLKKLLFLLIILLLGSGFLAYKMHWNFTVDGLRNIIAEQKAKMKAPKDNENQAITTARPIPFVRTATIGLADKNILGLSGIVRARYETPLAFQIAGRIINRKADTGQHLQTGDVLFILDDRDVQENIKSAQADVNAAQASLTSASSELKRTQVLHRKQLISTQVLELAQLGDRQARAQLEASKARLSRAKITRGYTTLQSPESGVLVSVTGDMGQVVAAGQIVALLAHDGHREIEVAFPGDRIPPEEGALIADSGRHIPLDLREISGSVDPQSRTWRVRYTINENNLKLGLGSVVHTQFSDKKESKIIFSVPISAIDERGEGAYIWQIIDGKAQPKSVSIVRLRSDMAQISGNLTAGEKLISLGTHLLVPGMEVQELPK